MDENAAHGIAGVEDLDGSALCDEVSGLSREALTVAARRYAVAHQWCVTHPPVDEASAATFGDARLPGMTGCDLRVGGEGAPGVAVFAVEAYAANAGVSTASAVQILSDALDLQHRLRRTWARVVALEVPAWTAAQVARETNRLSQNCANWIDQRLDDQGSYSWKQISFWVKSGIATFHPELLKKPEVGKEDWDVTVDHGGGCAEGTSRLDAVGDSVDLEKFHQLINDEATTLGRLGDPDTHAQRRAKALGVIADRQATCQDTLDLPSDPADGPAADAADGPAADAAGDPADDRESRGDEECGDEQTGSGGEAEGSDDTHGAGPAAALPIRRGEPDPDGCAYDYTTDAVLEAMAAAEARAHAAARSDASSGAAGDASMAEEPPGHGEAQNADLAGAMADAGLAAEAAHGAAAAARAASVAAGFGNPVDPRTGASITKPRSYVSTKLYVHLDVADIIATLRGELDPDAVVVDAGRLGPQLLSLVQDWLATLGSNARITPVIDLAQEWAVDQHDPPDRMREQVQVRDQHCVFPHCTINAHRCDLDHIVAYDPHGPPGQTSPSKLACLCRAHHRMKTFTGWSYLREADGSYVWTSPHRQRWRVVPGQRTTRLDDTERAADDKGGEAA